MAAETTAPVEILEEGTAAIQSSVNSATVESGNRPEVSATTDDDEFEDVPESTDVTTPNVMTRHDLMEGLSALHDRVKTIVDATTGETVASSWLEQVEATIRQLTTHLTNLLPTVLVDGVATDLHRLINKEISSDKQPRCAQITIFQKYLEEFWNNPKMQRFLSEQDEVLRALLTLGAPDLTIDYSRKLIDVLNESRQSAETASLLDSLGTTHEDRLRKLEELYSCSTPSLRDPAKIGTTPLSTVAGEVMGKAQEGLARIAEDARGMQYQVLWSNSAENTQLELGTEMTRESFGGEEFKLHLKGLGSVIGKITVRDPLLNLECRAFGGPPFGYAVTMRNDSSTRDTEPRWQGLEAVALKVLDHFFAEKALANSLEQTARVRCPTHLPELLYFLEAGYRPTPGPAAEFVKGVLTCEKDASGQPKYKVVHPPAEAGQQVGQVGEINNWLIVDAKTYDEKKWIARTAISPSLYLSPQTEPKTDESSFVLTKTYKPKRV